MQEFDSQNFWRSGASLAIRIQIVFKLVPPPIIPIDYSTSEIGE